jgi:hypothetical protein
LNLAMSNIQCSSIELFTGDTLDLPLLVFLYDTKTWPKITDDWCEVPQTAIRCVFRALLLFVFCVLCFFFSLFPSFAFVSVCLVFVSLHWFLIFFSHSHLQCRWGETYSGGLCGDSGTAPTQWISRIGDHYRQPEQIWHSQCWTDSGV